MNKPSKNTKGLVAQKQNSNILLALTGAATRPQGAVRALTHAVTGAIQGRGMTHFKQSWDYLVKEGSIDPKYIDNPWAQKQFNEVLKQLNSDDLNEDRVEAMINVFLNSSKENNENTQAIQVIQIMKTICTLSTTDIYILKIIGDLRKKLLAKDDEKPAYDTNARSWIELIFRESNLGVYEFIFETEQTLIEKRLLSDRTHGDKSGVDVNDNYRLTEFGIRLINYMSSPVSA